MEGHSNDVVKAHAEVIGRDVIDTKKEKIGKIEELVLDKVSGTVRYAVMSFGGLLGIGEKYFAIPWKQLSYYPAEKSFMINITHEKMKNAPGFNKDAWPSNADHTYYNSVNTYYDHL